MSYFAPFPSYRGVLVEIMACDTGSLYLALSLGVKPWRTGFEHWALKD